MTRRTRWAARAGLAVMLLLIVSFAVPVFLGSQVPKRFGDVGAWIPWYCWDKGDPRPHIEDAAYFDHPCNQDELPPIAQ
jgi:hypothetical protein